MTRASAVLYLPIHLQGIVRPPPLFLQELPHYPFSGSQPVRRTPNPQSTPVQHVRVYHRRAHDRVPQKLLQRPDVVPVFEQVGRERVTERVTGRPLRDPRFPYATLHGTLHRTLHRGLVQVMPAALAGRRVPVFAARREHPLPCPVGRPRWRLPVQRRRQRHAPSTARTVTFLQCPHPPQMRLHRGADALRQHRHPVLSALSQRPRSPRRQHLRPIVPERRPSSICTSPRLNTTGSGVGLHARAAGVMIRSARRPLRQPTLYRGVVTVGAHL